MRNKIFTILIPVTFLFTALAISQETAKTSRRTYRVEEVQEEIKIDGVLTERVWQKSPTFTLDYETRPADNTPTRIKTDMWITFNPSHLYVAARARSEERRVGKESRSRW